MLDTASGSTSEKATASSLGDSATRAKPNGVSTIPSAAGASPEATAMQSGSGNCLQLPQVTRDWSSGRVDIEEMLSMLGLSSSSCVVSNAIGQSAGAAEEANAFEGAGADVGGQLYSTPARGSPGLAFDWFNKAIISPPPTKPFARALNARALVGSPTPTAGTSRSVTWAMVSEEQSASPTLTSAAALRGVGISKSLINSVKSLTVAANTSVHSEDSATSGTGSALTAVSEWQQFGGGNGQHAMPLVSSSNANAARMFTGHAIAPASGYPSHRSSEAGSSLAGVGPLWYSNAASSKLHSQLVVGDGGDNIDGAVVSVASQMDPAKSAWTTLTATRSLDRVYETSPPTRSSRLPVFASFRSTTSLESADGTGTVGPALWPTDGKCLRGEGGFGTIGSAASSSRVRAPPTVAEENDSSGSSENEQSA